MVGKAERQDCAHEGDTETQADECGHAEEVVSDDEGTVGREKEGGLAASSRNELQ